MGRQPRPWNGQLGASPFPGPDFAWRRPLMGEPLPSSTWRCPETSCQVPGTPPLLCSAAHPTGCPSAPLTEYLRNALSSGA